MDYGYRLLLVPVFACLFFLSAHSQNTCITALPINAVPYASPAHTTGGGNPGYTTCNKGNDYTPAMVCGNAAMGREDAMFRFTPTAANSCISITLSGTGLSGAVLNTSAALFIYDGCPDVATTTCIAQKVNAGAPTLSINNLNLTPGQTYYIMVDGGTACFPYRLRVDPGGCSAGASCENPIEVTFPFDSVVGTTAGMGVDYSAGNGCIESNNTGEDVVYHLNIPATRCIRYKMDNPSANGELYITKGCPGSAGFTCVRTSICRQPQCKDVVEEATLTPGDYYFIIKSDNATAINFLLTIQLLSADDNVACKTCNDEDNCAPCKNSGFEKMSLQGWTGAYGTCTNPGATAGFRTGPVNEGLTRHTVVTRGHFDTLITTLPVVPPNGGDYAVRLGNSNNNSQAEQLSYSVVINPDNTNFIYQYAVVFEDPAHPEENQPFFSINMKINGKVIDCATYEVRAKPGLDGFKNGGLSPGNPGTAPESLQNTTPAQMYYKEWTTVNIPLIDYLGQTAVITFTTKDCNQGGHFGYAYIDAKCEPLEILKDTNLYCNHDTVTLKAPNGFVTYRWSTGETTQTIEVTKKGTYTVTCTTVSGCVIVLTNKILIEEPPIPNFTWEFNCKDSIVTFTDASTPVNGNPILKWVWSFGDGDSAFVKNPKHKYTFSGDFNVTLTLFTEGGCSSDTMITLPIDVFMPQGLPNAIDTIRLCEKETLFLQSDSIPLTKYEWTGPNGFSSNEIDPIKENIAPKDTGWYRLKITIKDCVIKFDSTYLIVEPLKKVTMVPDTIICEGDTAQLYCSGGKTYLWSPGQYLSGTTITNPKAFPPVTTTFQVTMFNDLCPDTTLFVEVRVLSGVVNMQMPDTLRVCLGSPVQLQASTNGFDVFKWSGPQNFQSASAQPTVPSMNPSKVGYYRLDCSISTNQCLVGADSTWVDLWPDPVIKITRPAVICVGDSIQLTASGAASYVWSPIQFISNSKIANPKFYPPSTRKYTVTGTSVNGCKGTDTITVIIKPLPVPSLGPDILLCLGDTAYLKTTQRYDSVRWSTNSILDSIMVVANGNFGITVWSNGCKGADDINVTFQDPGSFSLGPDTLLCEGTGYYTNINLGGVDSVRWNDNVRTLNRTILVGGTYYVDIYAGKCAYTDTIIVSFDTPPVFDLGPDSTVCIGSTVFLDATHPRAIRYEWSTNDNTPTITVAITGQYVATVYSVRCQYTDVVNITVVNPPVLDLGPDKSICIDDSVQFTSNVTGNSYLWSTGETTPSIWASSTGDYSLIVEFGPCTLYDTVHLFVQPRRLIDLGPDTTLCESDSLTIFGPQNFDTYLWSTNETTRDISPKVSGNYSLLVREGLCYSSDTIRVTFDTIPDFTMPRKFTICNGDSVILNSPLAASNYLWSTGETTPVIIIKNAGYYSLFIQNGKCNYKDSSELEVITPPSLYIGPDKLVCIGTGVQFGDTIPFSTFKWNTGDTTAIIQDQKIPQAYSVVVKYKEVCELRDTAILGITYMPQPDLGPDLYVCEGSSINLFANTFGEVFKWNTNSTSNTATVNQQGTYWVEVTNGYCINSDTITIRFQPMHQVVLPPDVEMCSGEKYDVVPITNAKNPVYLWSNGMNSKYITVRNNGAYVITVVDGVCEARDTINVVVRPLPNVEPIYELICPEDSVIFHLPPAYDYYLVSSMTPFYDTVLYPQIEYNLVIFDTNGCRWETSIKGELDMNCERDVYVPNTFTPNGDGENDVFRVVAYNLELVELLIFNRWGEKIFETNDPARGWNGNFKGDVCKTDVYEWKLIYKDNYHRRKIKIGHVNLLK